MGNVSSGEHGYVCLYLELLIGKKEIGKRENDAVSELSFFSAIPPLLIYGGLPKFNRGSGTGSSGFSDATLP